MNCIQITDGIKVTGVQKFDLAQTLDCGQSFRWKINGNNHFCGVAYGKYAEIYFDNDDLIIKNATIDGFEKIWKEYFDLDTDYELIKTEVAKIHPILAEASAYAGGIRILKQEPFEALCSFIISQNNNIKRISGIIDRLCQNFGEQTADGNYKFVTAERLASLTAEDLAPLRAGFRARYLIDAAQKVVNGTVNLEACFTLDYESARKELMQIVGVGTKVADCTLLFGMHRIEAFPVDVWIKKAMATLFPTMTASDFGPYAGIAQQYIFHYSRMHQDLFK